MTLNQCTNMCDLPKVAPFVKDVVENRDALLGYVLKLPSDGNSVQKKNREQTIILLMSKHEAVVGPSRYLHGFLLTLLGSGVLTRWSLGLLDSGKVIATPLGTSPANLATYLPPPSVRVRGGGRGGPHRGWRRGCAGRRYEHVVRSAR